MHRAPDTHDASALLLAGVGAVAATLGRLTLARLSHVLIRKNLLSDAHRANIDPSTRHLLAGVRLVYVP